MKSRLDALAETLSGRYEIEGELAQGGMSIVYRGRDLGRGKSVAIKVLRDELSSSADRARFEREIEVEASLDHPNILPVLDWGVSEGPAYYVMPLVEGESLKALLDRVGPLPVDQATGIIVQVAEGLAHAHQRGVLHRDVKPGNILLQGEQAILTDFGIARALDVHDGQFVTSTGVVVGTPAYMSPEQASGARDIDGRSDVYALACVLFQTLAGEPPFSGRTPQAVIARHVLERVPSLEIVRPGLPRRVVYAVERGMAKSPADRFATVSEFREALLAEDSAIPERGRTRNLRPAAMAIGLVLVALAVFQPWGRTQVLDDNRVVGFPLAVVGSVQSGAEIGEVVALAIGSALEAAEPLRWIDGWRWMDPTERREVRELTPQRADAITRDRRARYRIEGQVILRGDSASVVVALYDVSSDTEVDRRTHDGLATTESMIGGAIQATVSLLPSMVEPGRNVDITALLDRDPGAVALLMFGNREYRASRFASALGYYERALEQDEALFEAALRAAPAASWLDRTGEALSYAAIALAQAEQMSTKQRDFARGLNAYLSGDADVALASLALAADADPDWPDAHFAMGEVLRHLLPRPEARSLTAEEAYMAAVAADPDYTPALFHLSESALWRAELEAAEAYHVRFAAAEPDSVRIRQLELMLACARGRVDAAAWRSEVESRPQVVLEASYSLIPSRYSDCAKSGFRALLASDETTGLLRWNALLALQSIFMGEERGDSAKAVVEESIAGGLQLAYGLYVIDGMFGAPTAEEAVDFLARLGGDLATRGTQGLWLQAEWSTFNREVETLQGIADALRVRAARTDATEPILRRDRLFAGVAAARLAALGGDTANALQQLDELRPTAHRADISWSMWESLGFERLAQAQLLFDSGRYEQAELAASELDHPGPVIYRALQPASLRIRIRTAQARNDRDGEAAYRARLNALAGTR